MPWAKLILIRERLHEEVHQKPCDKHNDEASKYFRENAVSFFYVRF
jgi:hypothetical protein